MLVAGKAEVNGAGLDFYKGGGILGRDVRSGRGVWELNGLALRSGKAVFTRTFVYVSRR